MNEVEDTIIYPDNKTELKNSSLTETHPEIALQWHYSKNTLTPQEISATSSKKVWWKCPQGADHEWQAIIYDRTKENGTKCPVCLNQKVVHSNCLMTIYPEIAKQWHHSKNGTLTPHDVTSGSHKKIWWQCEMGDDHEWEANVYSRTKMATGCPICSNQKTVLSNCLITTHPELSKQWHPTKNGKLSAHDINSGSEKKVWWKCNIGDDHEWQTAVSNRAKQNGSNCPVCSNKKTVLSNCLATTQPEIARQWHPNKNGALSPYDVTSGYAKRIWWKCNKGDDHEWEAKIVDRTKPNGTNCPICINQKIVLSNCLATTHPDLAKQWHPTKNGDLTPFKIGGGSGKAVWWKCDKADDHEWNTKVCHRSAPDGSNCPACKNMKVVPSNCLATTHPELTKQWHPTKNGSLTPYQVTQAYNKKVFWKCEKEDDHEWAALVRDRTKKKATGCPICKNTKAVLSNCLATTHPDIARQWHQKKNADLTPLKVVSGSNYKVWWKCEMGDDHEWEAQIIDRTKPNGTGCPICSNQKIVPSNCLVATHPDLAKQWHPTKNGDLTPFKVGRGSNERVMWKCENDDDHEWETKVNDRAKLNGTGCPICNKGWTIAKIRLFVKSLLPHIESLTPAELYIIFQQNGIAPTTMKGKSFLQALKTGKFPKEELEKFVDGKESLADEFIADPTKSIEDLVEQESYSTISDDLLPSIEEEQSLIETERILSFLDSRLISNVDQEAIEFFITSATAKIWNHAFINEEAATKQLEHHSTGLYAQEVKRIFSDQYYGAKNLVIPEGYNFKIDGKLCLPNLMQLFTAYLLKTKKRLGNWSGTGAGKTLSAILASRVIDAHITIICCPNSVTGCPKNNIEGWYKEIVDIYPDSKVFIKDLDSEPNTNKHNYYILNYEFFQQGLAENKLKKFIEKNRIDFVVIDEIHFSKQREVEKMSTRKKVITAMLSEATGLNANLCVLGMSATPVINNLFEGKTLIELITGVHHDELNTKPTITNCMSLHQKLVSNGIRWRPKYNITQNIQEIEIDCSDYIDEIRSINTHGTQVDLEAVLTLAKLPEILKHIKHKTVVYTHYIKNILTPLKDAIEQKGWSCSVFSGDDKTGLNDFLLGNTDVLIATSCLSTGVNGLQRVCNRVIINVLPWTHAEFEQLKGRIYRQGQKQKAIDIIVPLTFATINGERRSWCEYKWRCIKFKKSIADAAVDGEIPEGHIRSPAQAYQDIISWFNRLEKGCLVEIQRERINMSLSTEEMKVGYRKFGDFSKMNHQLNTATSANTHQRFKEDPAAWKYYHQLYREARQDWAVIPYQEAIKWCKERPHIVIGDFGCGESLLAQELDNQVHSFDHVAVNPDVIACDMAHVPLDDEILDAALFSLSLMGSNYIDYIKEAHRCLKLDGYLWIAEATSRFHNLDRLDQQITELGFDIVKIHEKANFTFLRAIKSNRTIKDILLE